MKWNVISWGGQSDIWEQKLYPSYRISGKLKQDRIVPNLGTLPM